MVSVLFGANDLIGNQINYTFIYRTNATTFKPGTFGMQEGSAYQGVAFAPAGNVPEPAIWGMMLLGFGAVGAAMRRRRIKTITC